MNDFVLLHANLRTASELRSMVANTRAKSSYRGHPTPIVINEDSANLANFEAALDVGVSWGYFDPATNNYRDGFQSPPVNWTINTSPKRAFFARTSDFARLALAFGPAELRLAAEEGEEAGAASAMLVAEGAADYTLATDASWLAVTPFSGETPTELTVTTDPTGLAPGTYTATVVAAAERFAPATLTATFVVTAAPTPALGWAPTQLALNATEGGSAAAATATLAAPDQAAESYTVGADVPWLAVSPAAGTTPAELTVTADPTGLAPGTYAATITASAEGFEAATLKVAFTVTVTPPPPAPALAFGTTELTLDTEQGGSPAAATATLAASDASAASYAAPADAPWLTVSPAAGTTPAELTVTADPTGLAPGSYSATLTATAEGFEATTLIVTLTVRVPKSVYALLVSTSSSRSNPVPLEGTTVSGKIYVFIEPTTGIRQVRFFLDRPDMSGRPVRTERFKPYDLGGTKHDRRRTAKPFDTSRLSVGAHTLTAAIDLRNGGREVVTVSFTVERTGGQ